MSEKFNEFCDGLMKKFEAVESNLSAAETKIEAATNDAVYNLKTKHSETKQRIAQLKSNADAKIAELRLSVETKGEQMESDLDSQLEKLQEDFEKEINSAHEAWHKSVADLTGGTIF